MPHLFYCVSPYSRMAVPPYTAHTAYTALRPLDPIQVFQPHQHIPRLAAVGGAQNPRLLELVDDARRAAVADAHAALQQRRRPQLILDADLRGLSEQRVAIAGLAPTFSSA